MVASFDMQGGQGIQQQVGQESLSRSGAEVASINPNACLSLLDEQGPNTNHELKAVTGYWNRYNKLDIKKVDSIAKGVGPFYYSEDVTNRGTWPARNSKHLSDQESAVN